MAASPATPDASNLPPTDNQWNSQDPPPIHRTSRDSETGNGLPPDDHLPAQNPGEPDYTRGADAGMGSSNKDDGTFSSREKQVKPNKIYIGGLPEHARQEDLQHCFGKLGNIVNIELKVGYGFVEFDSRESADEAVTKYDEGFFMGNKIRVELSHGGGRTAKYTADPGACFKCGQVGHWARECPNHPPPQQQSRRDNHPNHPPKDYAAPPQAAPARDYGYRDEYARYPPSNRYQQYDYPPPPGRDYRRPPSPARDYRDYSSMPPRPPRDYDDYRRGPPPPHASNRYEPRSGYYLPDGDGPPAPYPQRGYSGPPGNSRGYAPPPPPRDYEQRYDKRPHLERERYPPQYNPMSARPRSPPVVNGPPRPRDDFDRPPLPPRDYPPTDYRGRPASPRYGDYPPRNGNSPGYRRRSASPRPPPAAQPYDPNYSNNGYPTPAAPVTNGAVRAPGSRDYPPRNGDASYRRP